MSFIKYNELWLKVYLPETVMSIMSSICFSSILTEVHFIDQVFSF